MYIHMSLFISIYIYTHTYIKKDVHKCHSVARSRISANTSNKIYVGEQKPKKVKKNMNERGRVPMHRARRRRLK